MPAFAEYAWQIAVNNGDVAPGNNGTATFRSYNQPSTNDAGVMVFRARAAATGGGGGGGGPQVEGIYYLDQLAGGSVVKLFERGDAVPAPNNVLINGNPSAFNEFPSTPRIDPNSNVVAHRGQHEPVWKYLLADGTETRVGTAGVYAWAGGLPYVAASQLGAAVEPDQVTLTFPWFSVPATTPNTRFDQFPGSPAVDGNFITWKGNYTDLTDGLGRTGIYYRLIGPVLPTAATGVIANSETRIPNQPAGGTVRFGSTAPPSAANGSVVFTGFDVETAPTLGGVYRSNIAFLPALEVIAGVGEQVPGEPPGTVFYNFSEGLSVSSDASKVAFWGSWGDQFFQQTLTCPADGNPDLIAYCLQLYPGGTTVVDVRVNQGIFLYDRDTGVLTRIARTGQEGVTSFVFWGFSGRVPGVGGVLGELVEPGLEAAEEEEFARWRSAQFMALSHRAGETTAQVAFKAERNGHTGIYVREGIAQQLPLATAAEELTTPGQSLDSAAPVDSWISSASIERDGFRNGRLAITASMLWINPQDPTESLSCCGIYVGNVPLDYVFRDGFED